MNSDELNFDLPPDLIAQTPAADRAGSRLLHYQKEGEQREGGQKPGGVIAHHLFSDLPKLLRAGDLLVFNDTRVLPARFYLRKDTGGRIEALFLAELHPGRWQVLLRGLEKHRGPLHFEADPTLSGVVAATHDGGLYELDVNTTDPAAAILARIGRMPLPPYIRREKTGDPRDAADLLRYQTIYAQHDGSVAAPTAGLHFTPQVLADLQAIDVRRAFVTLHVGLGTFKPLTAASLSEHVMHAESYSISREAAAGLNLAKREKRRIIAVGTTSARVLESQAADEPFAATSGQTAIFIYPPYRWRHIDALITNFHLPRSTLIALVAALVGLDEQRRIYAEAIAQRYRFFSYGDATLIE